MGTAAGSVRVRHAEHVMGTVVSFDVPAAVAGEPLAEAVRWLHWVDARFSPFRADSDVSRLGRGEVSLAGCAPEVGSVLAACEAMAAASDGYFSASYAGRLDPSGYVKGWAIERVAALLTAAGSAGHCVNGGGDVQCAGGRGAGSAWASGRGAESAWASGRGAGSAWASGRGADSGEPWRVGIADPLRPRSLCRVVAGTGFAVATSGIAERGAHIIDPHTGRPATGLLSVTVVGPHLAQADAYATAAVAMGPVGARDWIETLDGYCGFAIEADGASWETTGFSAYGAEGAYSAEA